MCRDPEVRRSRFPRKGEKAIAQSKVRKERADGRREASQHPLPGQMSLHPTLLLAWYPVSFSATPCAQLRTTVLLLLLFLRVQI